MSERRGVGVAQIRRTRKLGLGNKSSKFALSGGSWPLACPVGAKVRPELFLRCPPFLRLGGHPRVARRRAAVASRLASPVEGALEPQHKPLALVHPLPVRVAVAVYLAVAHIVH